jgi:hypothetical protein
MSLGTFASAVIVERGPTVVRMSAAAMTAHQELRWPCQLVVTRDA